MTLLLINVSSVVFAIVMTAAAFVLYRLTRSTGILVLLVASFYLTGVRLTIAAMETFCQDAALMNYRSHLIAPFWPAMAVGFLLLVRSLRSLYAGSHDRRQHDCDYCGPDRRKHI